MMDLRKKRKVLSAILSLAKKGYRKKKEQAESAVDLKKSELLLRQLNEK